MSDDVLNHAITIGDLLHLALVGITFAAIASVVFFLTRFIIGAWGK